MNKPDQKRTFPKSERLHHRKSIEELFQKGSSFYFKPLLVKYHPSDSSATSHQILFAVPKKSLKRAVDRNLIKRRLREAYRKNKGELSSLEKHYNIAFIYRTKEILSFKIIEQKLITLLGRLAKKEEHKLQDQ